MRRFRQIGSILVLFLALGFTAGCDDGNGHGNGDDNHGGGHAHGGGGHEDHGDHGGSDRPAHVVTMFGEHTELFVEFPTFVAGEESKFAAHFTRLEDYRPIGLGTVTAVLTSADSPGENWSVEEIARPGIFTPVALPKYEGKRKLVLTLKTETFTERFDLGEFEVFGSTDAAREVSIDNPKGDIGFLKEQQWMVDFDVAKVTREELRPSVPVNATLRPAADGEATINAPFDGRITAPEEGVPQVGERVDAGQIIAYVVPKLEASDVSQVQAELRKAEVMLKRARRDEKRIRGLVESGALPARRLEDVESEVALAEAEIAQARRRLGQSNTLASRRGARNGAVAIRSSIDGMIAQRSFVEGGFVSSGQELVRVIDRSQLWVEAHIPEANLTRVGQPTGLWFGTGSDSVPVEINVSKGGKLISFGEVIDRRTRTAPLIFELGEQPGTEGLRAGAFIKAHVLSGEPRPVKAIPASAVLDEQGIDVVYVMVGGESFERRTVRLGIRDREMVEVIEGLEPGEVVVSEGAYYVRLASTSTGSIGHGHAH